MHQTSVDTYLEDIILGAVDSTADVQARAEIHAQAQKINDVAYEIESRSVRATCLVSNTSLPNNQKVMQVPYFSYLYIQKHKEFIQI